MPVSTPAITAAEDQVAAAISQSVETMLTMYRVAVGLDGATPQRAQFAVQAALRRQGFDDRSASLVAGLLRRVHQAEPR